MPLWQRTALQGLPRGPRPRSISDTLETLLLRALEAQRAGQLDAAARAYERALEREPGHFDALHMLGVVHFQRGAFARARELVARAVALRPDVEMARRNLRLADNALRRERAEARYRTWIDAVERPDRERRAALRAAAASAPGAPRFSIVTPTYDSPEAPLRACLDSVLAQDYPHWELCIADDASPAPHVRRVLAEYAARDARIRVALRERNGHISAASNSALALATGDFVVLLDHDDLLPVHALGEVATEILAHPGAAIVYSDEDKVDVSGQRFEPYFKPDWNPALLTAQNYVSHLGIYKTSLVREVGGFRDGVEGAQDWDLLLRCAERAGPAAIRHIPRILYHWRAVQGSTARSMENKSYAARAQERVVTEAFARRGLTREPAPHAARHVPRGGSGGVAAAGRFADPALPSGCKRRCVAPRHGDLAAGRCGCRGRGGAARGAAAPPRTRRSTRPQRGGPRCARRRAAAA